MDQKYIFELHDAIKTYTLDQDKIISPEETVEKGLRQLSFVPDLNIQLLKISQKLIGSNTYTVKSKVLTTIGKGVVERQARASAVMEFVERFSWLNFDYKNSDGYLYCSYDDIVKNGSRVIGPKYFFSNFLLDEEYEKRLLEEVVKIEQPWVKGYSLTNKEPFYYPIGWHNAMMSSNGLASGNSYEEAVFQGTCEMIERENLYRFFVGDRAGKDVDPKTIKHPLIQKILDIGDKAGIEYFIKDISFEFGIPTFIVAGKNHKTNIKLLKFTTGQGTHTDPEKALLRAFSEYYECVSTFMHRAGALARVTNLFADQLGGTHTGLLPGYNPEVLERCEEKIDFNDIPDLSDQNIKVEIERMFGILQNIGYEIIAMNKTHPTLDIPVVRIMIPGLRVCMSSDFLHPEMLMSQIYAESGNLSKSEEYFNGYLAHKNVYISKKSKNQKSLLFENDYQKNLKKAMAGAAESYKRKIIKAGFYFGYSYIIRSLLKPLIWLGTKINKRKEDRKTK